MINTAAKAVQIKTTMGNHQIPTNTGRTEKTSYQSCQAHRGLELINTQGSAHTGRLSLADSYLPQNQLLHPFIFSQKNES